MRDKRAATRSAAGRRLAPLSDNTTAPRRPLARRTQASRSKAAREKLLQATLEVLRERGYSGLTTKEVAVKAGFSNGALMHHYSSKADRVIAAGAHIYERHITNGRRLAESAAAKADPLKAYIADCEDVYLGASFIPTIELMVAARTDPLMNAPFNAFMQNYRATMNEIWLKAFMRAGYSKERASFVMMSTLFMIRGMGINSIWQKDMTYYRRMLRSWTDLATSEGVQSAKISLR